MPASGSTWPHAGDSQRAGGLPRAAGRTTKGRLLPRRSLRTGNRGQRTGGQILDAHANWSLTACAFKLLPMISYDAGRFLDAHR